MDTRRTVLALGVSAILVLAVLGCGFVYLMGLGGVSSAYRARDGDLLLTRIARGSLPIADALDRYHREHNTYPRADEAGALELRPYRPTNVKIIHAGNWLIFDTGSQPPWIYAPGRSDGSAFSLSIKLGWDPRLVYLHDRTGARWVFVPGDGSEEKPVLLSP